MRTPAGLRLLRSGLFSAVLLIVASAHALPTATAVPPAQQGSDVVLVNADEPFIERRSDGSFIARPILNVRPEILANTVKDPRDGQGLTPLYRVQEEPRRVDGGWEYTIRWPHFAGQPDLDPERVYVLVLYAQHPGGLTSWEKTIPAYEPTGLWDRVIEAFNPARWARSFAGWVIEGVHGVLCSVLARITGSDLESCQD